MYSKYVLPDARLEELEDLIEATPYFCGATFPPEDHVLVKVCSYFTPLSNYRLSYFEMIYEIWPILR